MPLPSQHNDDITAPLRQSCNIPRQTQQISYTPASLEKKTVIKPNYYKKISKFAYYEQNDGELHHFNNTEVTHHLNDALNSRPNDVRISRRLTNERLKRHLNALRIKRHLHNVKTNRLFNNAKIKINTSFDKLTRVLEKKEDEDICDVYAKLLARKLRKYPDSKRDKIMYKIDGLLLDDPYAEEQAQYNTKHTDTEQVEHIELIEQIEQMEQLEWSEQMEQPVQMEQREQTEQMAYYETSTIPLNLSYHDHSAGSPICINDPLFSTVNVMGRDEIWPNCNDPISTPDHLSKQSNNNNMPFSPVEINIPESNLVPDNLTNLLQQLVTPGRVNINCTHEM